MKHTVGVIGLGNMGRGIAKNISKGGHNLLVWDAIEKARAPFAKIATITEPAEMAASAEFILSLIHI